MVSFRKLFEADEKEQEDATIARLKETASKINESFFQMIDKYTVATLTVEPVAIINKEGDLQWMTNKSGSMPLVEDNKRMLLESIKIYELFYNKFILKHKELLKEKAMKEPARLQDGYVVYTRAFDFLDKAKFSEDVKSNIDDCKALYDFMLDEINVTELSKKTNENFFKDIQSIKSKLSGLSAELLPEGVKIESELDTLPDEIPNEQGEQKEDTSNTDEIKKSSEELSKIVAELNSAEPDKYEDIIQRIQKGIEVNKKNIEEIKNNNKNSAEYLDKFTNAFGDHAGDILPISWVSKKLSVTPEEKEKNESLRRDSLYSLLFEDDQEQNQQNGDQQNAENKDGNAENGEQNDDQQSGENSNMPDDKKKKAEEANNKIKENIGKSTELINIEDDAKFKSSYEAFVKSTEEMFKNLLQTSLKEKFEEIKDTDPLIRLCKASVILTTSTNEEGKEGEQNSEQTGEQNSEQNGDNKAEQSGEQGNNEQNQNKTESLEDDLILHNFLNHLNEHFRR